MPKLPENLYLHIFSNKIHNVSNYVNQLEKKVTGQNCVNYAIVFILHF